MQICARARARKHRNGNTHIVILAIIICCTPWLRNTMDAEHLRRGAGCADCRWIGAVTVDANTVDDARTAVRDPMSVQPLWGATPPSHLSKMLIAPKSAGACRLRGRLRTETPPVGVQAVGEQTVAISICVSHVAKNLNLWTSPNSAPARWT